VLEQLTEPRRISNIALAAGEDLDVPGVDQHELEVLLFEHGQIGFQYCPVASMTTFVTPSSFSQRARA
jgi:hypothetical protein